MDNNFSAQVKEIISFSREEALRLGNDFIGTEHLLLGLIRDGDNTAIKVLKQLNVDLYELRKEVELAVKDKTGKNIANINSLPLTKQAEKVIRVTVLEAKALKSPLVETEHLMLSILKNKENIATQILNQFDVDYDLFRNELGMVGTTNPPPHAVNSPMMTMMNSMKKNVVRATNSKEPANKQVQLKAKHRYSIISGAILPSWLNQARLILLLDARKRSNV
jgi:ATP-dependent Clp protease ATP-binding subunit ClpA